MSAKERAIELFNEHIALATTDGRKFRKTIMETLMAETGCTEAAAATHYNQAKKQAAPIEGLGRAPVSKNVKRPSSRGRVQEDVQDDDECYTVLELLKHEDCVTVGRCRSYLLQGDASEAFDERVDYNPNNEWVMIKGLGPLHGETYKLSATEKEIKRYTPAVVAIVDKPVPILIDEETSALVEAQ